MVTHGDARFVRHPLPPLWSLIFAVQNLKDAIMVTKAGAETLPWLSSCVILPASMGYFMLYKRMVGTNGVWHFWV